MDKTTLDKLRRVKELWNIWDIRVFMLTSLTIQALLTYLAPRRKRSASSVLNFSMWLLYLSADAVALFTIGLIANSDGESPQKEDLLAFWAPFLLLHLGGPDTITALALEDNELWHRHALQLVAQVAVTLFVFGQSLRLNTYLLWPTLLMFVDGIIKYIERTEALYFASMDCFRESFRTKPEAGPDYALFMEEYSAAAIAHIPITIQDRPKKGDTKLQGRQYKDDLNPTTNNVISNSGNINSIGDANVQEEENVMIKEAYGFYTKFKGLLADSFLTLKDREESSSFFLSIGASKAFRIVEIELNIIYDVFYTKVFLLQNNQAYLRIASFLSVVASLIIFSLKNKGNYHSIDVGITFALLTGAIALDISVSLMLVLSDWWILITPQHGISKQLRSLLMRLLQFLSCTTGDNSSRWSHSLSKYNFLERCFKNPPSILKYIFIKGIKDALIRCIYVQEKEVEKQFVVKFIIEELQRKAKLAPDLKASKEIHSARGNLVLEEDYILVSDYLSPWTVELDYDESVLIWHLATDICYWTSNEDFSTNNVGVTNYRGFCKQLSDYMSYLLLQQPSLVSSVVGMSEIRFKDTCEEARKFMNQSVEVFCSAEICSRATKCLCSNLSNQTSSEEDQNECPEKDELLFKEFCKKVLKVKAHIQPIIAKGDKSKSVLFDACRLAEQLKMLGDSQWEITSKVWVELLCYAATRCSPRSHVAQLRRGGELVTLVWLLMAHLGVGERFLQNQGFGWTKLIIHK